MRTERERTSRRLATRAHAKLAEDLRRALGDAGLSVRELARGSGLDSGHVVRILAGSVRPTIDTYARLALPLGLDLSCRLYPNTGPLIRDRWAGPMLEGLLGAAHPRWARFTEVAVRRPGRGFIDAVLHEPRESLLTATELQSELRRLEQLVRWHALKADSLPSWDGWPRLEREPTVSRLLVVRRTRATRQVAAEFARQLRVAYPAHPDDALAALCGTEPWPGAALVWMVVDARGARFAGGR